MPKSKTSAKAQPSTLPPEEVEIPNQEEESTSSDQESDAEVSFHANRLPTPPYFPPNMFRPYIEGPCMDSTVNDGLYHSFLKWRLKCKNILEYELAALPEHQKCKKVVAWNRDFWMDQYVSWSLPKKDLSLDTIWKHFEEFCKPPANEVRAHFDLLTSFRQGTRSIDECYNMVQAQINLSKYPLETAKILHRDIFWFFLKDEEFVSKTINEGSVDLDKFPASKVHQLAKKMESSKATPRHIKQVAGDPQVAQINLMCHQCTELSNGKYKKKKSSARQKQLQHKNVEQRPPNQYKKSFDPRLAHKNKYRCSKCGDSAHLEGFQYPAKKFQCKACHKFGHYTSLCFQKTQQKQANYKHRKPTVHQLKAGTIHVHDSNEEVVS